MWRLDERTGMMSELASDPAGRSDPITDGHILNNPAEQARFTIAFDPALRPTLAELAEIGRSVAHAGAGFSATAFSTGAEVRAELLVQGLAFDCQGVRPSDPASTPETGAKVGIDRLPQGASLAIVPGPYIGRTANLLPVIKAMAGVAARIANLRGVLAIHWQPAQAWIDPAYFIRVITEWIDGGAFPALGLTMLQPQGDRLVSQGLGFFIGQEIEVPLADPRQLEKTAQIALRLIHELVTHGPIAEPTEFDTVGGRIIAVPVERGKLVQVRMPQSAHG